MPLNRSFSPLEPVPPVNRRTTSLPKIPASRCTLRITLLLCVLITFPIYMLNLYHIQEWIEMILPFESPRQQGIYCVKPMGTANADRIAEFITYHQLAIFIANLHFARVSFPPLKGVQAEFIRTFGDCLPPSRRCTIRQSDMTALNCPPGDCACLAIKVGEYVNPRAACWVLGVMNSGLKNHEFSGCMGSTLRRYFTIPSRWPRSYDVVQYVATTDPKSTLLSDGQAFTKNRFEKLMQAMCVMSHRDIIVITNHTPTIPLCGNRTVLARVTEEEALMIASHAVHLSVAGGSMGRLMMEISTARRVILLSEVQKWFLWLHNPKMTLVRKDGRMLNTVSAAIDGNMEKKLEEMDLEIQEKSTLHGPGIPMRRWEKEAAPF